jgi:hypothetical protein
MPLTLKTRIGTDTPGKLEAAATRRYAEAIHLLEDEPLGAIYLLGYTIEMRLKAAHYRLVGIPLNADISAPIRPNNLSPRKLAEDQVRAILGSVGPVGHHLLGWARLVIDDRVQTGLPALASQSILMKHVGEASLCWTESLRYHANKPYDDEVEAMKAAASWMRQNYRRLWS